MGLGSGEAGSEIESGLAPGGDGGGVVGGGAGAEGEAVTDGVDGVGRGWGEAGKRKGWGRREWFDSTEGGLHNGKEECGRENPSTVALLLNSS